MLNSTLDEFQYIICVLQMGVTPGMVETGHRINECSDSVQSYQFLSGLSTPVNFTIPE